MRYKDACEIAKDVLREITESDNAVCYINSVEDKEWLETAIKALELTETRALEQEPKTGHWINAKVGKLFPSNDYKCSECGNILDFDGVNCGRGDANFCPNCGARMVESQESEE